MSDDVFDGKMLSDKLFKLNSSQQSIECINFSLCLDFINRSVQKQVYDAPKEVVDKSEVRKGISEQVEGGAFKKKAKQIVEIWHKSFKSAQQAQQVSFLYLANDILQNSRRKGNEFVNEFWKVIPSTLKHVNEHGDDNGKKAASRLVGIWEDRRVFGSRGQNLRDEMLGKSPLPQSATNGKTSSSTPNPNPNPIKIVKRDSNSLRLKLTVGGAPEKIITAFHLVHDENATEDTALNNCEGAVHRFGDLEREIETQGVQQGSSLLDEIQEQENVLQECVNQLETAEKTRSSLISQLKEALQDQELRLDVIHSQLQVARNQIDHAVKLRKRLTSPSLPAGEAPAVESLPQSMSVGSTTHVSEEESKKAAAAAMAAKLAASTSSAQMLTSVLSSLVAEEAASINNGFNSSVFATNIFPPEKRPKLENPMSNSDMNNSDYFTTMSQANQTTFPPLPQAPLPSSTVGTNSPSNQFVQSSGGMMMGGNGMPFVYGASSLPPPPPSMPHVAMGMMRPAHPPPQPQQQLQQQQHQQLQQQQQQQTTSSGYYRPPGIGFYGQNHQPTPPAVPRQ